ncbi:MAG: hypothetical protein M9955_09260 [Rhizobiaceae bacterium]|nr:hypothetical protein [Rhizobiaceae bacterium]
MIGRKAPSEYLGSIQSHKQVGLQDAAMDAIVSSHLIDAATLRSDDFELFYERRRQSLLDLVEQAMGKVIDRGISHEKVDDTDSDEIQLMAVNA